MSGLGAEVQPGLLTQRFGQVKGETEVALAAMTNQPPPAGQRPLAGMSVRPAGVDPHGHTALEPFVPRPPTLGLRMTRALLGPVFRATYPAMCSPTLPLGIFLAKAAMGSYSAQLAAEAQKAKDVEWVGANFPIVNNAAFRRLMQL